LSLIRSLPQLDRVRRRPPDTVVVSDHIT
jgi:hypothetical protein